jgi:predicted P-loop ATPase
MIPKITALSQIDGKFTPVKATNPELNTDGSVRKPSQGKACYIKDWQKNPKTLAFCQKEIDAKRATGYGLILGNGIVAIDFDGPTSTNIAGAIGPWLVEAVNHTLSWSSGKADGYYQVAFLIPDSHLSLWESIKRKDFKEYKGVKGENGDHLEIRYNSMQSVLPPSWHSGDLYYKWVNESEILTLTEQQSQDLLDAYHYKEPKTKEKRETAGNKESGKTNGKSKAKLNKYEQFLASFTLPTPYEIDLLAIVSPDFRDLIFNGASEGNRDDSAAKIARDLVGCENYLKSIHQNYSGSAEKYLYDFISACNPPLSNSDYERILGSAINANPTPCLDEERIKNCIAAQVWNAYEKQSHEETKNSEPTPNPIDVVWELLENEYGDRIKLNELTNTIELDGEEAELDNFYLTLYRTHKVIVNKQLAYDLVVEFSKLHAYHPVKRYLDSLPSTSPNILDSLASRYFGVRDSFYNTALKLHLIGSVARIYEPGCKKDECLILKGPQGIGKSSFWETLYGKNWFTDSVNGFDKDNLLKLHQHWCCELAEIESITNKKESGELKAFLSTNTDTFRLPYAKSSRRYKRRTVFVGSVNKDSFLVDDTGSRRFPVIPVEKRIPITLLQEERDLIWGAAVQAYKEGHRYWFTESETEYFQKMNERYEHQDSWEDVIAEYLNGLAQATTRNILEVGLKFDSSRIQKRDEMRVTTILNKLGWVKAKNKITINGVRTKVWEKVIISVTAPPTENNGGGSEVGPEVGHTYTQDGDWVSEFRDPPAPPISPKHSGSENTNFGENGKTEKINQEKNITTEEKVEEKVGQVFPSPETLATSDFETDPPMDPPMDPPPLYERLVTYCSYAECSESSILYGLFEVSSFWELDDEQAWQLDKELVGLLAEMAAAQRKAEWEF